MNREANTNASYNAQKDMLPLIGLGSEPFDMKALLAEEMCIRDRVKGIEPSCQPWQGCVLPLNYTCDNGGPDGT